MDEYHFILGVLTGTCFGLLLYRTILDHLSDRDDP